MSFPAAMSATPTFPSALNQQKAGLLQRAMAWIFPTPNQAIEQDQTSQSDQTAPTKQRTWTNQQSASNDSASPTNEPSTTEQVDFSIDQEIWTSEKGSQRFVHSKFINCNQTTQKIRHDLLNKIQEQTNNLSVQTILPTQHGCRNLPTDSQDWSTELLKLILRCATLTEVKKLRLSAAANAPLDSAAGEESAEVIRARTEVRAREKASEAAALDEDAAKQRLAQKEREVVERKRVALVGDGLASN